MVILHPLHCVGNALLSAQLEESLILGTTSRDLPCVSMPGGTMHIYTTRGFVILLCSRRRKFLLV